MTGLRKEIRKAVLTAKNLATKVAPGFSQTPLKAGGRTKMFQGGKPPEPLPEPELPIKVDDGATDADPHSILDMPGNTFLHDNTMGMGPQAGPFEAGKHARVVRMNREMIGGPESQRAVEEHVTKHPVHAVIATPNLHYIKDREARIAQAKRAHRFLKPGGKAYFQIDEGDRSGIASKDERGIMSNNKLAPMYMNEIGKVFPKVTRIQHIVIGHKEK